MGTPGGFVQAALHCLTRTRVLVAQALRCQAGGVIGRFRSLCQNIWSMKFRLDSPEDRAMYMKHISVANFPMCGASQSPAESIVSLLRLLHQDVSGETSDDWMRTGRSFIIDNFVGHFRKISSCTDCSKTTTSFEPFCVINIPVIGTDKRIAHVKTTKLTVCVTKFFSDNCSTVRPCNRCQESTERVERFDFWVLPQVLAFHLNYQEKEPVFVDFPDFLDFSHLVPRERTPPENGRYRLFAVVNRDRDNWGVNVIVQNPMLDTPAIDGTWFVFGPDFAMLSPEGSWHSSQASVLLYERW
jgi:hypothetical protein